MKRGDLVKYQGYFGVVTQLIKQKHWDTSHHERGAVVSWDKAPMLDFACVSFYNGSRKLLQSDLEVISEGR